MFVVGKLPYPDHPSPMPLLAIPPRLSTYINLTCGIPESWPVLERVVLVEAWDQEEASRKAALLAKQEQEGYTGPGFRWAGDRPAECVFMGVRKPTCVSSVDGGSRLS